MNEEPTITVKATRKSCFKEETKIVDIVICRQYHESLESWWIYIASGGVTGYESMMEDNVRGMTGGWSACAGTKSRWDSLFISAEEMLKIANWIDKQRN